MPTLTILTGTKAEIESDIAAIVDRMNKLKTRCDCFEKSFQYELAANIRLEKEKARLWEALSLAHAILNKLSPAVLENAAMRAAVKHNANEPLAFITECLQPKKVTP